MDSSSLNRRPLTSRDTGWARATSAWLAAHGATPNTISLASIAFGALAGWSFWQGYYLLAIVGMQGRLLCNLFDGMVAVEGGKKTASGEVFNDAPDRASDLLILVPAGYACGVPDLGWAAGVLAVLTAYARVLGGALGLPQRFLGPMAKQHRMAVLTAACVVAFVWDARAIRIALVLISVGSAITVARRLWHVVAELERRG